MAATTKPNNVVMDDQRKNLIRDLLLGNLKPSRLSKLTPELIVMIMESLFNNGTVFPDYPDIIKALDVKSEATAFHYTLETFIRHSKRARLDQGSLNQFPKLLEPEHHVDGELKVGFMDKSGTKIQLQSMCESFGFRFYDLYITDLCLNFRPKLQLESIFCASRKPAEEIVCEKEAVYLWDNDISNRLHLAILKIVNKQMNILTNIQTFYLSSNHLTEFRTIDTLSNDKKAYMTTTMTPCAHLTEGVYYELSVDDPDISQSLKSYGSPAEDPPIVRQVTFWWIATEGLKADVSKIDQLEPLFNERSRNIMDTPKILWSHADHASRESVLLQRVLESGNLFPFLSRVWT
ncbi:uncharacterized protein EAF01_003946 [Botrytis porri]|uniref:uncharacterized protein n=1 Tax=Botrytis porri TaxID=87229 RepID=UPI0019000999|nr:uncharacterized protein EAF01_003946 [Botrytis porri]KAF7908191.1 hypothetical protein EAF01_003946 [Botrytis porri]